MKNTELKTDAKVRLARVRLSPAVVISERTRRRKNFSHNHLPLVLLATIGVSTLVDSHSNLATAADMTGSIGSMSGLSLDGSNRRSRVYAGVGFGASWLAPDTSDAVGVDPNDRLKGAGQITLGYDLNHWLSLEAHGADLGKAGLNTGATIAYREFGTSALFYLGGARERFHRRGMTAFGRLGLGYLSTTGSAGLDYKKENSAHLILGAGVEYMSQRGLGLRAEGIAFDQDVSYGQFSLLYRFGGQAGSRRVMSVVEKPASEVPVVAAIKLPAKIETTPVVVPEPVPAAAFAGLHDFIYFAFGSADLNRPSRESLSKVAATLIDNPGTVAVMKAHTDSLGDLAFNRKLSEERALASYEYLVGLGVAKSRLRTVAMGESMPISSNKTSAGRHSNRRVEISVAPE